MAVTIQLRGASKLSRDSKGLPDLALAACSVRSVILVTTPWDASPVLCNCRCKLNMQKQVLAAQQAIITLSRRRRACSAYRLHRRGFGKGAPPETPFPYIKITAEQPIASCRA